MEYFKSVFIDKDIRQNVHQIMSIEEQNDDTFSCFINKLLHYEQNNKYNECNDTICIIQNHVFNDLELFTDNQQTEKGSVAQSLMRRSDNPLKGSYKYFNDILKNPISCIKSLKYRQICIKNVNDSLNSQPNLNILFSKLKLYENDMRWVIESNIHEKNNIYDLIFINVYFLNILNKSPLALTSYNIYRVFISPIIGILCPLAYFIIPYLTLVYKYNIGISFMQYVKLTLEMFKGTSSLLFQSSGSNLIKSMSIMLTGLFYFQSIFNSLELSKAIYKLSNLLYDKINGFSRFICISKQIINKLWNSDIHSGNYNCIKQDTDFNKTFPNECFDHLIGVLDKEKQDTYITYKKTNRNAFLNNFGKELGIFKYLNVYDYIPVIKKMYFIDCLRLISNLVNEKNGLPFCFSEYVDANKPILDVVNVFHPYLPPAQVVLNNVSLTDNNMLLTGPNAGGKSTLIKSFLLSIFLSQTLSISCSSQIKLTPFSFINTQINVPDCKGKQSLFEAEMHRNKFNFHILNTLGPRHKALIVIDELFSSTNPVEGIAGAYSIAKKFTGYTNMRCIISTHYTYLSKLEKETNFKNYKMNVQLDKNDNVISYPYKLRKGISNQYIALELLKLNGYDRSIIDDAINLKYFLLNKTNCKKCQKL